MISSVAPGYRSSIAVTKSPKSISIKFNKSTIQYGSPFVKEDSLYLALKSSTNFNFYIVKMK